MSSVEHDRSLLGAYSLGALDPAEEHAVRAHVSTCPDCQRELAEFMELRQALDQVPPEAFLDGPPDNGEFLLQNTLRRVRSEAPAEQNPRRPWNLGLVAASVVLLAAAGLGGGVIGRQTAPDDIANPPVTTALPEGTVRGSGTDTDTGASMNVTVEPRAGWVWVTADIKGVPAGLECELLVIPRDGEPLIAGSWKVSEQGEAKGLQLEGTAAVDPSEVQAIEIVTVDGQRMVSVAL